MRRFSQRNSLVTLNEINITPLLDLAFVLLIIFVITRPLLEQNMNMDLPQVGHTTAVPRVDQRDIRTVEISQFGLMKLGGQTMNEARIEQALLEVHRKNPKLVVNIRADKRAPWDNVAKIMNICLKNGITRVAPQTAPDK